MAQLTINYTATRDIKAYAYNQTTGAWCLANIDQNASTWDSTTKEGTLVFNEGVTELPDYTFRSAPLLTLDIHPGWTRFGNSLSNWCFIFADCVNLTSVKLPNTVTFLGGSVFSRCSLLHDVDLGSGLEKIGQYCFDWTSIEEIVFPASLTEISMNAFVGSTNITKVTCKAVIPPILGSYNFENNNDTLYVQPSSVSVYQANSSWNSAFSRILSLLQPNEITYTAASDLKAFSAWTQNNVDQLLSTYDSTTQSGTLVLNSGVTSIGQDAFRSCTDLTSIMTGEDITSIDQYAFNSCSNLNSIDFSATLTSIGFRAFQHCTSLTSLVLPDSVTDLANTTGGNCFGGCTSLANIKLSSSLTLLSEYLFEGCTSLVSIEIPDGITKIDNSTFSGCTGLTKVLIPSTATEVVTNAFYNCPNLVEVVCLANTPPTLGNGSFSASDDTLYVLPASLTAYQSSSWASYFTNIAEYNTIHYKASSDIKAAKPWLVNNVNQSASTWDSTTKEGILILNSGVTTIGAQAFYNLNSLIEIDIPNSITSIDSSAFTACYNLTTATLHNGLTSIASDAFYNCSKLTSITIPATVISIAENSFKGTNALASITVDSNNTIYDSRDICNAIIETATNKIIIGCKNSTIPNTVVSLGEWSFQGTNIVSITIPASVASIHYNAFNGTVLLTSITVDSNNQYYNDGNGQNCIIETATNTLIVGTRNTTIPNTVVSIKSNAFYGKGLTSINIPASVTSIEQDAFMSNTSITSITVDSNNQYYSDGGVNMLIETSTNSLILMCRNSSSIIPEGIEIIKIRTVYTSAQFPQTSITLPSTLISIADQGFWNDSIYTVICKATTPPTLGWNNFSSSGTKTLYVDVNSIDAYKATHWNDRFTVITAYPSITYTATEDLKAYSTWLQNNVDQTYSTYDSTSHIGQLMITESIDTIGASAFENCTAISEIEFKRDFVEIEDNAFNGCSNLLEVTCKTATPPILGDNNFTAENDTLYTSLNLIPVYEANTAWRNAFTNITYNKLIIDYVATSDLRSWATSQTTWVRDNVDQNTSTWDSTTHEGRLVFNSNTDTVIPNYAFYQCYALQSFKLGKGWTQLGDYAFRDCTSLFSATLPININVLQMGLFYNCVSLTSINIPSMVAYIMGNAFYNCIRLTTVICKATTPPTLASGNFTISNDTLYVYPDYISTYSSNTNWRNAFTNIKGIYTVTTSAGQGGTITPTTKVLEGENITIYITPDAHYEIESVTYDGIDIGTIDNYTIQNVDADHTISVTFKHITHTITATAYEGGAIVPTGNVTVSEGESQTFDIIPLEGYDVLALFIDGTQIDPAYSYTFTDVEADHTIDAMFYSLQTAGFNREQMLDLDYLLQTYIEQLRKKRV